MIDRLLSLAAQGAVRAGLETVAHPPRCRPEPATKCQPKEEPDLGGGGAGATQTSRAPASSVDLKKKVRYAEAADYTPSAVHFQMNWSGTPGWSTTDRQTSQTAANSQMMAMVRAPVMSRLQRPFSNVSRTERPLWREPTTRKMVGA